MRVAAIILIVLCCGCDLLNTRTPEPPQSPRTNYTPATSPSILFSNMQSAFKEKIVENYLSCFVDSAFLNKNFVFVPSTEAVSQYSSLSSWNLDAEKQFFNALSAKVKSGFSITLQLLNESSSILDDSRIYQYDYDLTFPTDDPTIPTEYSGKTQFKIYLDSRNQWVIVEWSDFKNGNNPSWSELKGRLY